MTFTQSAKSISVMKTPIKTLIAGCLIGSFSPAFAASTVDLTVKGLIVPSACTPSLSASTVDVGRVSVKDLNQDSRTLLTPTTLTLSVNCLSPTLFAMKATDNRADSSITVSEFGVGKTATGEHIGGYILLLDNAIADTATVLPIASVDNGTTWAPGTQLGHLGPAFDQGSQRGVDTYPGQRHADGALGQPVHQPGKERDHHRRHPDRRLGHHRSQVPVTHRLARCPYHPLNTR
jgi:type 1 fimbria pilin